MARKKKRGTLGDPPVEPVSPKPASIPWKWLAGAFVGLAGWKLFSSTTATSDDAPAPFSPDAQAHAGTFDSKTNALIEQLHPDFKSLVVEFLRAARAAGIPASIESGYRSWQKQFALDFLAKHGQNSGRPAATPGQGAHERGVAVDVSVHGVSAAANSRSATWPALSAIAEKLGGNVFWLGWSDPPHFELKGWRKLNLPVLDLPDLTPAPKIPVDIPDTLAEAQAVAKTWA